MLNKDGVANWDDRPFPSFGPKIGDCVEVCDDKNQEHKVLVVGVKVDLMYEDGSVVLGIPWTSKDNPPECNICGGKHITARHSYVFKG